MTFEEQGVELRRLEAAALSLGLSDDEFVRIAQEVTAAGGEWASPGALLAEIRRRIHAADRQAAARVWAKEAVRLEPTG